MLLNSAGQVVNLPKQVNSHTHPDLFRNLREVLVPSEKGHGKMFNMETRARIKQ
jgi:hypothetical protein